MSISAVALLRRPGVRLRLLGELAALPQQWVSYEELLALFIAHGNSVGRLLNNPDWNASVADVETANRLAMELLPQLAPDSPSCLYEAAQAAFSMAKYVSPESHGLTAWRRYLIMLRDALDAARQQGSDVYKAICGYRLATALSCQPFLGSWRPALPPRVSRRYTGKSTVRSVSRRYTGKSTVRSAAFTKRAPCCRAAPAASVDLVVGVQTSKALHHRHPAPQAPWYLPARPRRRAKGKTNGRGSAPTTGAHHRPPPPLLAPPPLAAPDSHGGGSPAQGRSRAQMSGMVSLLPSSAATALEAMAVDAAAPVPACSTRRRSSSFATRSSIVPGGRAGRGRQAGMLGSAQPGGGEGGWPALRQPLYYQRQPLYYDRCPSYPLSREAWST